MPVSSIGTVYSGIFRQQCMHGEAGRDWAQLHRVGLLHSIQASVDKFVSSGVSYTISAIIFPLLGNVNNLTRPTTKGGARSPVAVRFHLPVSLLYLGPGINLPSGCAGQASDTSDVYK